MDRNNKMFSTQNHARLLAWKTPLVSLPHPNRQDETQQISSAIYSRMPGAGSVRIVAAMLGLASFALAAPASAAADITITDAKIAGGKLVVTGTTLTANMALVLDGKYATQSNVQRVFTFNAIYLPSDCIVEVGKLGSAATRAKAVVANCSAGGLNPKGAWNAATSYVTDDLVASLGSSWRAKRVNLSKSPSASPQDWEKFASKGDVGVAGTTGNTGANGTAGQQGTAGANGSPGAVGAPGAAGTPGAAGAAGTVLAFAEFYALMAPDNAATVAAGIAVAFPTGVVSGSDISQLTPGSFNLSKAGVYLVMFQVSVTEAGQLVLATNGIELPASVAGRATGASQIVGMSLVTAAADNTVLQVRNPSGNTTLTITPSAGGSHAVSAHVTILRLS
jgi:hypothetical protein